MCWLDEVQDNTGWLAAGSKSGLVSLWMVKCNDTTKPDLAVTLVNWFQTDLMFMTTLHWTTLPSGDSKCQLYLRRHLTFLFLVLCLICKVDKRLVTSSCRHLLSFYTYNKIGLKKPWTLQTIVYKSKVFHGVLLRKWVLPLGCIVNPPFNSVKFYLF